MMRATLCANSSMSAEPLLTGSDGALTVTPRSAVLAWARQGLSRPQMDFTLDRIKTHHGPRRGRRRPGATKRRPSERELNLAFVILEYYPVGARNCLN